MTGEVGRPTPTIHADSTGPARRLLLNGTDNEPTSGTTYDRWRAEHDAHAASVMVGVIYPDGTPGTPVPLFDPGDV